MLAYILHCTLNKEVNYKVYVDQLLNVVLKLLQSEPSFMLQRENDGPRERSVHITMQIGRSTQQQ